MMDPLKGKPWSVLNPGLYNARFQLDQIRQKQGKVRHDKVRQAKLRYDKTEENKTTIEHNARLNKTREDTRHKTGKRK